MNARLQLLVLQRGNLDIITLARSVIQDKDSMERVMSAQSQDVLAHNMSTSKINLHANLLLIKRKKTKKTDLHLNITIFQVQNTSYWNR